VSKNIKSGSWWVDVDGDIVYVAFVEQTLPFEVEEGRFLCYYDARATNPPAVIWYGEADLIRELPGCTGFDYKVPPEIPHSSVMNVPPQWIPYVDGEGKAFLVLGYQCQPVDATAG